MRKNFLLCTLLSESVMTACFGVDINTKIYVNKNDLPIM